METITLLGLLAAVFTTSSFIPQAIKTIRTKNTKDLSLTMYAVFSTGVLLWLIYGLFINDVPVIIANAITMVFALIILSYKIRYKWWYLKTKTQVNEEKQGPCRPLQ